MIKPENNEIAAQDRTIRIRARASFNVDGSLVTAGMETMLTPRQYHAVARHVELLDGDPHPAPQAPAEAPRKKDRAAAIAAALVALLICLFGLHAQAAWPASYGNLPGGVLSTNGVPAGATVTWSPLTNGLVDVNNNPIVTNFVSLAKTDEALLTMSGGTQSDTGGFTNYVVLWGGDETGSNWDTNHPLVSTNLSVAAGSNAFQCVSLPRTLIGPYGSVTVGVITNIAGGKISTNLNFRLKGKSIRAGT
jgi:hypothetical protein